MTTAQLPDVPRLDNKALHRFLSALREHVNTIVDSYYATTSHTHIVEADSGTLTAGDTEINPTFGWTTGSLSLFLDGVKQESTTYTEDGTGRTITLDAALTENVTWMAFSWDADTGATGAGDHVHAYDYTDISGNDANTNVTGLELEELTDGSDTTLHEHSYTYTDISGYDAGTDVSGAELEELTDGSVTTKHDHNVTLLDSWPTINYAYVSGIDAGTDITAADLEDLSDGGDTVLHGHDVTGLTNWPTINYAYVSGNDGATDVTAAQLETLSDSSNADALHVHTMAAGVSDEANYLLASGARGLSGDWDAGSHEIRAETLESDVATGTAPLTIASTTLVTNLNADKLDGYDASSINYAFVSGNDGATNVTAAELETLTDGSVTALHSHAGGGGWDPVAFSAYNNAGGDTTIATATWTKITFAQEDYDYGADYDTTTSYYTAPLDGIYHFDWQICFTGLDAVCTITSAVYVDTGGGDTLRRYGTYITCADTGTHMIIGSVDVDLDTGDKVSVYAWQNGGGDATQDGNTNRGFSGFLVKDLTA